MGLKTKNGICAITLTSIATIFVLVSFCTSYWLVNDGKVEDPKFVRIGEFNLHCVGVAKEKSCIRNNC